MQTKNEGRVSLKLLLLVGVLLISTVFFLYAATSKPEKKYDDCSMCCKKINADIINSVAIKLM